MKTKNQFLFIFILINFLMGCYMTHAQSNHEMRMMSPEKVLQEYLFDDSQGMFLSSDGWAKQKDLVVWEDTPGWDEITIISDYKIKSIKQDSTIELFEVTYHVLGTETSIQFTSSPKLEVVQFKLQKINGHWKIVEPQLRPHVIKKIKTKDTLL